MASIAYSVIAAVIVIAVLMWAIRSGQFRQQDRARYLPLADDAEQQSRPSREQSRRTVPRVRTSPLLAALLLAAAIALGTLLLWLH